MNKLVPLENAIPMSFHPSGRLNVSIQVMALGLGLKGCFKTSAKNNSCFTTEAMAVAKAKATTFQYPDLSGFTGWQMLWHGELSSEALSRRSHAQHPKTR